MSFFSLDFWTNFVFIFCPHYSKNFFTLPAHWQSQKPKKTPEDTIAKETEQTKNTKAKETWCGRPLPNPCGRGILLYISFYYIIKFFKSQVLLKNSFFVYYIKKFFKSQYVTARLEKIFIKWAKIKLKFFFLLLPAQRFCPLTFARIFLS